MILPNMPGKVDEFRYNVPARRFSADAQALLPQERPG